MASEALHPGLSFERTVVVTDDMTAAATGNRGVPVLSTPHLIGLMETASHLAVDGWLEPGQGTVGTHVDVRHLAATPPGETVTARAVLTAIEGRKLFFDVEAHDEHELVGDGRHERFVIDLERFLRRIKRKAAERA
ncbi:MAG: thioesterase family protein [Chloroflexota bacterium]